MAIMEKGYGLGESFVHMIKNINPAGVGTGLVATLFSTLGPGVIVLASAKAGGLTEAQQVSWIFAIYAFGGLSTMFMSLKYRLPLVIAYSIPGAVILGKLLPNFTVPQAVGAYMFVGVVALILTVTGFIKKVVDNIPVPIMLGMVGGVLFSFGVSLFKAAIDFPYVYGVMVIAFFLTMNFRSFSQKIPPIIVSIVIGAILIVVTGKFQVVPLKLGLAMPVFVMPEFSMRAIVDIGIPLFFLVIGVQNIQAVGVLLAEDYKPPINSMYFVPAIGAFINGFMGAHNAVHAGPSVAICASESAGPDKGLRYIAAFWEGVFWFIFALSAQVAVEAVKMVPKEFTAVLAGLAMFEVFASAFRGSFSGRFKYGAVVAFFIAVTNQSILNVGAPLWAIIFGVLTSLVVEKQDFKVFNNKAA